jgi:hypothetical protein
MKSQKKSSLNCANLIKECTTFNIYITTFKPNKVSTSINKDKLDLAEGIVGASNAIFMRRMQYIDKTHLIGLIIKIHVILMFHKILLPVMSMILTDLVNSKCILKI